jgi:hypothetical protein
MSSFGVGSPPPLVERLLDVGRLERLGLVERGVDRRFWAIG